MSKTVIAIYILAVLMYSAFAVASEEVDSMAAEMETSGYVVDSKVGQIIQMANGNYALVISETEFYKAKSNLDLSAFVGSTVAVKGYEVLFKAGPALELNQMDPLLFIDSMSDANLFFISSISSISE